jgi:hypothetical protein
MKPAFGDQSAWRFFHAWLCPGRPGNDGYMKKWPNVLISLALCGWNASLGSTGCAALKGQERGARHREGFLKALVSRDMPL